MKNVDKHCFSSAHGSGEGNLSYDLLMKKTHVKFMSTFNNNAKGLFGHL